MYHSISKALRAYANPEKARVLQGFFRTGKGDYGEGDRFLGITVPQTRSVAHQFAQADFPAINELLASPIHEERLAGWLILVRQYEKGNEKSRQKTYDFYLKNARRANNWDLVDLTAPKIAGAHLLNGNRKILDRLAKSASLWERRIAIVATYAFIRAGEFDDTFRITGALLGDPHDLIHKACGWMLREVGKKDSDKLEKFLKTNYQKMPRTMLRYAIERFPEKKRKAYLNGEI